MKSSCFNLSTLRFAGIALLVSGYCQAADIYILPQGSGSRDGSSWQNAKAGSKADFAAAWNALSPGDTLHVGSGTYKDVGVSATKGGEEGKSIRLLGEDRGSGLPLCTSNFNKTSPGNTGGTFFESKFGTSNFEVSGFHLKNYKCGVFLRGRNVNVKISNMNMEESRECIRSEGGAMEDNPTPGTHNVTVTDCRFFHYTKGGIRLQEGNYNWRIERCLADAGGKEWATEPFHEGFHVIGSHAKKGKPVPGAAPEPKSAPDHHIEFYDCTALNSYSEATSPPKPGVVVDSSKLYWNGDGFCDEAGCHHIRFVRCVSMHHTDGGWDVKSDAPELIDCVALDNKENYRLWSDNGAGKMYNCISGFAHKRGGSGHSAGLWGHGSIDAQYCTYLDNETMQLSREKEKAEAKVVFKDSIFSLRGLNSKLGESETVKFENSVTDEKDPKIAATKATGWTSPASATAYDNAKYGETKGFSSKRWSKGDAR